ncbi:MAG: hypothetical protein HFH30_09875 [Eubacterium sp.]|nr:hypothetical protein [Eubacterium sp.]
MKYGLLKYSSYNLNIGDYMQLEGIKQAYKRMNISKEDIIEIERDMLADYEGGIRNSANDRLFCCSNKRMAFIA